LNVAPLSAKGPQSEVVNVLSSPLEISGNNKQIRVKTDKPFFIEDRAISEFIGKFFMGKNIIIFTNKIHNFT
jgi:hypothetical protein